MRIYLDFDNTLVATRTFYRDFYTPILVASGSTAREIEVSYKYFSDGAHIGSQEPFTPERQMTVLGWREVKQQEALLEIENIIREHRGFIFPDVVEVLTELRRRGHTLILLTFGDRNFQKQKITASGIAHLLDEIIITTEDKLQILKRDCEGEPIVFVDDKSDFMERLGQHTDILTFHICRPEVDTSPCEFCPAHHEIVDLKSLLNIIPS